MESMARYKVPDERRQRIAQACRGCQTRKQKCDGREPCSGCQKRGHTCRYEPPKKRRSATRFIKQGNAKTSSVSSSSSRVYQPVKVERPHSPPLSSLLGSDFLYGELCDSPSDMSEWSNSSDLTFDMYESAAERIDTEKARGTSYFGGSASAIFIDEIRKLVRPISGYCPFTEVASPRARGDVSSGSQTPLPEFSRPDLETAQLLVDSATRFSTGLVEVLDAPTVQNVLQTCYSRPTPEESGSLCLLYLLLATGYRTAGTWQENEVGNSATTLSDGSKYADMYFELARAVLTRLRGNEEPKLWTIHAWALMAAYSISISEWNAADGYIGSAVRGAYALGIHKPHDASTILANEASSERMTKLWKGLFVLDTFVAAFLGRPVSVIQDECGFPSLNPPPRSGPSNHERCLDSNVMVSETIRKILKLMYTERKFPAEEAMSLLKHDSLRIPNGRDQFEGEYAVAADDLPVLRARLLRNYATVLLTRPFLVQDLFVSSKHPHFKRSDKTWNALSKLCISAALDTIERIHSVHKMSQLPHCDSMWWPFLWTATLVILSNEFFDLHKVADASTTVSKAFSLLEKCLARDRSVGSEFDSLCALRLLAKDRSLRVPNPVYSGYLNTSTYGGFESPERFKLRPVFPTLEFASGCGDSMYCGPDGRHYSVQSTPSVEYMDQTISPAMSQIYQCDTYLPSMNTYRCSVDPGYYEMPAQPGGHEGGTVQVTQGYTPYPDHHLY